MEIKNIRRVNPVEMRFTIIDGERETMRYIFLGQEFTNDPINVMKKMAESINHYMEMKAADFPYDFNLEEHIAGIERDAARYGCD